ncbi:hypothetical protein B0T10DRAFT_490987 [Thelonectria olida]|uniref:Uncharacterized protein n=1 Tax=Thelonectria olida TaxID=1576542 RepID=A0A9P8W199_9HYPO|nr:hypothetical protein B0T10DRAFT_490987 [Thelonectria olida]
MKPQNQDPIPSQQAEEEGYDSSCSEDDEQDTFEEWGSLVDLIKDKTRDAFEASPQGADFSVEAFQGYWRDVFQQLAVSVKSSPNIPTFLTSPPVKKFTVTFFEEGHVGGCPCCLPDAKPGIVIANENGVTKDDLMEAFVDYMYGDGLPTIHSERGVGKKACALMHDVDWMSESTDKESGRRVMYGSWMELDDRVPKVFMYCCGPEKYAKKRAEEEEEEMKTASKL